MSDGGRIDYAKKSAKSFIEELLPSSTTRIAIVTFDSRVYIESGLTNNKNSLNRIIDGIDVGGGTFTQAGIRQAELILQNSTADNKHIVLLSDGEPTYSYEIRNPDRYLEWSYVDRYSFGTQGRIYNYYNYNYTTNRSVPESQYNYNYYVGEGTAMFHGYEFRSSGGWRPRDDYSSPLALYNHGNSAINEARFAKDKGYTIWSIGLEVGELGNEVLEHVASQGKYYKATSQYLQQIYI